MFSLSLSTVIVGILLSLAEISMRNEMHEFLASDQSQQLKTDSPLAFIQSDAFQTAIEMQIQMLIHIHLWSSTTAKQFYSAFFLNGFPYHLSHLR